MIDIDLRVDELKQAFEQHIDALKTNAAYVVLQGCKVVEAEAKRRAPVDSGLLRRSITSRVTADGDDVVGQVGTNVEYAKHVEFGHRTRLGTGEKASSLVGGRKTGKDRKGKNIYKKTKTVHFVPGRFFLYGALNTKRQEVISRIIFALGKVKG